ncbi:hypothetical protein PoB_004955000 [Plakobranchus ocellatus]|uniref:Uncharacterized protein n=1 Tax=Plakobranchus ocellatus TaxID=259542 RepID=A0AAV4BUQ9_9GAST|nr:hypothetical protein PoB_004955000 [Plakobranchus ocellatus]
MLLLFLLWWVSSLGELLLLTRLSFADVTGQKPHSILYEVLHSEWFGFLYIAGPQEGDLRLSGPPSGQDAGGRAGTRDRGSLRISKQICYPLCPRSSHTERG